MISSNPSIRIQTTNQRFQSNFNQSRTDFFKIICFILFKLLKILILFKNCSTVLLNQMAPIQFKKFVQKYNISCYIVNHNPFFFKFFRLKFHVNHLNTIKSQRNVQFKFHSIQSILSRCVWINFTFKSKLSKHIFTNMICLDAHVHPLSFSNKYFTTK